MNEFDCENSISENKNYLIDLSTEKDNAQDLQYLVTNFCGTIVTSISEIHDIQNEIRIYIIGDLKKVKNEFKTIFIVRDFSSNYEHLNPEKFSLIEIGKVPINIHNAGVFYRQFFDNDFFTKIESEHKFQNLTESNKPSMALRKGIYLSKVTKDKKGF